MPLRDAVIGMLVVCSQEPADPESFEQESRQVLILKDEQYHPHKGWLTVMIRNDDGVCSKCQNQLETGHIFA